MIRGRVIKDADASLLSSLDNLSSLLGTTAGDRTSVESEDFASTLWDLMASGSQDRSASVSDSANGMNSASPKTDGHRTSPFTLTSPGSDPSNYRLRSRAISTNESYNFLSDHPAAHTKLTQPNLPSEGGISAIEAGGTYNEASAAAPFVRSGASPHPTSTRNEVSDLLRPSAAAATQANIDQPTESNLTSSNPPSSTTEKERSHQVAVVRGDQPNQATGSSPTASKAAPQGKPSSLNLAHAEQRTNFSANGNDGIAKPVNSNSAAPSLTLKRLSADFTERSAAGSSDSTAGSPTAKKGTEPESPGLASSSKLTFALKKGEGPHSSLQIPKASALNAAVSEKWTCRTYPSKMRPVLIPGTFLRRT